jgi:hypothetical protein
VGRAPLQRVGDVEVGARLAGQLNASVGRHFGETSRMCIPSGYALRAPGSPRGIEHISMRRAGLSEVVRDLDAHARQRSPMHRARPARRP